MPSTVQPHLPATDRSTDSLPISPMRPIQFLLGSHCGLLHQAWQTDDVYVNFAGDGGINIALCVICRATRAPLRAMGTGREAFSSLRKDAGQPASSSLHR